MTADIARLKLDNTHLQPFTEGGAQKRDVEELVLLIVWNPAIGMAILESIKGYAESKEKFHNLDLGEMYYLSILALRLNTLYTDWVTYLKAHKEDLAGMSVSLTIVAEGILGLANAINSKITPSSKNEVKAKDSETAKESKEIKPIIFYLHSSDNILTAGKKTIPITPAQRALITYLTEHINEKDSWVTSRTLEDQIKGLSTNARAVNSSMQLLLGLKIVEFNGTRGRYAQYRLSRGVEIIEDDSKFKESKKKKREKELPSTEGKGRIIHVTTIRALNYIVHYFPDFEPTKAMEIINKDRTSRKVKNTFGLGIAIARAVGTLFDLEREVISSKGPEKELQDKFKRKMDELGLQDPMELEDMIGSKLGHSPCLTGKETLLFTTFLNRGGFSELASTANDLSALLQSSKTRVEITSDSVTPQGAEDVIRRLTLRAKLRLLQIISTDQVDKGIEVFTKRVKKRLSQHELYVELLMYIKKAGPERVKKIIEEDLKKDSVTLTNDLRATTHTAIEITCGKKLSFHEVVTIGLDLLASYDQTYGGYYLSRIAQLTPTFSMSVTHLISRGQINYTYVNDRKKEKPILSVLNIMIVLTYENLLSAHCEHELGKHLKMIRHDGSKRVKSIKAERAKHQFV